MLLVLVCSTIFTIGCVLTIVGALGLWRAYETDNTDPVRCTGIFALYGGVPEPSNSEPSTHNPNVHAESMCALNYAAKE